jgi:hypothetical protein
MLEKNGRGRLQRIASRLNIPGMPGEFKAAGKCRGRLFPDNQDATNVRFEAGTRI